MTTTTNTARLTARDNLDIVARMMSDTATTHDAQQMLWSLRTLGITCQTIHQIGEIDENLFCRVATFIETSDESNPNRLVSEARDAAFSAADALDMIVEVDADDVEWFVCNGQRHQVLAAILSELAFSSLDDVESSWVCAGDWQDLA